MAKCTYRDRDYSEGSEICQQGWAKICRNGKWEDLGYRCESLSDDDTDFAFVRDAWDVSEDGKEISSEEAQVQVQGRDCVKFISGGATYNEIYNSCGECQVAVVQSFRGGRSIIKEHKVPPRKSIRVRALGNPERIIDDYPCD